MKLHLLLFAVFLNTQLLLAQNQSASTQEKDEMSDSAPLTMFDFGRQGNEGADPEAAPIYRGAERRGDEQLRYGSVNESLSDNTDAIALVPISTRQVAPMRGEEASIEQLDYLISILESTGHNDETVMWQADRGLFCGNRIEDPRASSYAKELLRRGLDEKKRASAAPNSTAAFNKFIFPHFGAEGFLTRGQVEEIKDHCNALKATSQQLKDKVTAQGEEIAENELEAQAVAIYAQRCYDSDKAAHQELDQQLNYTRRSECCKKAACCCIGTGATLLCSLEDPFLFLGCTNLLGVCFNHSDNGSGNCCCISAAAMKELESSVRQANDQHKKAKTFYDEATKALEDVRRENSQSSAPSEDQELLN